MKTGRQQDDDNTMTTIKRYASLDAMRGLAVAAMLLVNNAGDWSHVYPWLEHAEWHGCTPADLIFPFFLFMVGVSLAFSLERQIELGANQSDLSKKILWRSLRIFALGLFLHVVAWVLIDGRQFRLFGVLQRIALCYGAVALLMVYMPKQKMQALLLPVVLLFYWALLALGGSYAINLNLVDRIDTALLGKLAYSYDAASGLAHEPEGILSTLPAMMTVLIGVFAGRMMRAERISHMASLALLLMVLAYAWSFVLPWNKQLWTSSFVCWTGGCAILTLLLMHWLIDKQGWPAIGISFGVNALAAYAGAWLATCVLAWTGLDQLIYQQLFAGKLATLSSPDFASLAFALAFTLVFAGLMLVLNKRGWRFSL